MKRALTLTSLPAILLLTVTGCSTDQRPIEGIVMSSVIAPSSGTGTLQIEPLVTIPAGQALRVRLNGEYLIWEFGPGDYRYSEFTEYGTSMGTTIPTGSYVVELVDPAGTVWGTSAPITVYPPLSMNYPWSSSSTVVFLGELGHVTSKNVESAPQDGDPATAEIAVLNTLDQAVAVDICDSNLQGTTCATIDTIAPGDEFRTVQAIEPASLQMGHSLSVHPASTANPTSGVGLNDYPQLCQVQELFVVGQMEYVDPQTGAADSVSPFALSSCIPL
jgi:hypothetical protein